MCQRTEALWAQEHPQILRGASAMLNQSHYPSEQGEVFAQQRSAVLLPAFLALVGIAGVVSVVFSLLVA